MNKKMSVLLGVACFFAGAAFGFLIAPAKQGFGNNCGNTNNYYSQKKPEETLEENQETTE